MSSTVEGINGDCHPKRRPVKREKRVGSIPRLLCNGNGDARVTSRYGKINRHKRPVATFVSKAAALHHTTSRFKAHSIDSKYLFYNNSSHSSHSSYFIIPLISTFMIRL